MSKEFETGTENITWSLMWDFMTEGLAVLEEGLAEEEEGLATDNVDLGVVEEMPWCDDVVGLGTLDELRLASGERESPLEGFSLVEIILWRKIISGSYSGSAPFSWGEEEIRLESLNMLIKLLVYTREPEGPIMWIPS